MKKCLKSNIGFYFSNLLCIAGMIGITCTYSSVIYQLNVMAFAISWCVSIVGMLMIAFGKEF